MGRAFEYRKAAKMKRWGTMSRVFPKLGKIITMAAKEGGSPDPDMNAKLRTAIANAKAQNMPKDNIEAAIKRAFNKDAADIKEITYDVKAPHGVQMIVECATDNGTRTVANVKAILNRANSEMLTSGSLNFMFTRKAVFVIEKTDAMDVEELELDLIDYGLEEIEEDVEPHENGEDTRSCVSNGEFTSFRRTRQSARGPWHQPPKKRQHFELPSAIRRIRNSPEGPGFDEFRSPSSDQIPTRTIDLPRRGLLPNSGR